MKHALSPLAAFAIPFALFVLANNEIGTWRVQPRTDIPVLAAAAAASAAAAVFFAWWKKRRHGSPDGAEDAVEDGAPWTGLAFFAVLLAATLTTFTHHREFHFLRWPLIATPLRHTLYFSREFHFLAAAALFAALLGFLRKRKWIDVFLPALLVGCEIACATAMALQTGGTAIYGDDHASFLFRVEEFWRSYPWRENYVTQWNAGVVNNVLASSGTAAYAWLTAPLRLFLRTAHGCHSWGMVLVHAAIVPWTMAWALREAGFGRRSAWIGALLALFANRAFFMWTFSFGTVGSGVSFAMAPAAFVFLYAVAEKGDTSLSAVAGLVFSFAFACLWPPMWFAAALTALAAATSWRRWASDRRTVVALCAAGACILLALAPTLVAVARARDLVGYTTQGSMSAAFQWSGHLERVRTWLADILIKIHPLSLVLGLGGLWILPCRPMRRWLSIATGGLLLVFALGPWFAPRMQMFRLVIAAGMLAIIPAALWCGRILDDRRTALLPLQASILALLLVGLPNLYDLYHGRGSAPFQPMRGFLPEFVGWIRANVPEGHRLLFAGRAYHYYGKGHVAYLPILTGREMMSCDYYEFPVGLFDPEYPPAAYHGTAEELHGFLARHGVSHVVAHCDEDAAPYRGRPEFFREVPEFAEGGKWGRFRMFEVLDSPGIVTGGDARATADFNRIDVEFGPGCERAVLAYNWQDRMEAEAPATIAPHPSGGGETFIEIRPNGVRRATIRYRPRF